MRRAWDLTLCALAAVMTFIAFPTALAPEWTFWPLLWVSHVPLLWLLRRFRKRQAQAQCLHGVRCSREGS